MKSVYILLITATLFEMIMQVYSLPPDLKEALLRSTYMGNTKPDQDYVGSSTLPASRYSNPPKIPSQTTANNESQDYLNSSTLPASRYPSPPKNQKPLNNESPAPKKNDDDSNKIKTDIQQAMLKTRSELKLNAENAQERMDQLLKSSKSALQMDLQSAYDDTINLAAKNMSSLRDQTENFNNQIQSTLRQLLQKAIVQIRQLNFNFSKAMQPTRQILTQFDKEFPELLNSLMSNMRQQRAKGLEKMNDQFYSILKELDAQIEQNRKPIFALYEQKKVDVRSQIRDIYKEIVVKARAIHTDMLEMFGEHKQNLESVYKKVQPMDVASAKKYANEEMQRVTAEMNKTKADMEQKMISEIKNVINMLRTEVESIRS